MTLAAQRRSPRALLSDVHALGRSVLLLFMLVMLLVLGAFFPHGPNDEATWPLRVANTLVLATTVFVLSGRRWTLIVAAILAVPALATHFGHTSFILNDSLLDILRIPCSMVFYLFAGVLIMLYSARPEASARHRLTGAACAYLMLGFTFASGFAMIDTFFGPALEYQGQPATNLSWMDLQYFSLCTLTTMGYGDFTPRLPLARVLAVIEAISGVMFVAVFISAVVGQTLASRSSPASSRAAS